jgi:integrase
MKYLVEEKDRHGNVRVYYRNKEAGGARIRIRALKGTPEFALAIEAAAKGIDLKQSKRLRAPPPKLVARTSLRWLVSKYYTCAEFKTLDPRTQHVRKLVLERLLRDGASEGRSAFGDRPFAPIQPRHVRSIRDAHVDRPQAANTFVRSLRQVFAYAVAVDLMQTNPAKEVPYLRSRGDGFHAWTPDEIEQFERRWEVGTKPRLAMALLLYTAQRRSDVVRLGPACLSDGWLSFTQFKGRNRSPIHLEIPIVPELQRIIAATPTTGIKTFLVTEFGKPFTHAGFSNWFRERCDEAGLPHCSAHGLRKSAASRLAELGCSEKEIMAITGHTTSKEVARYTKSAQQRLLAKSAGSKLSASRNSS